MLAADSRMRYEQQLLHGTRPGKEREHADRHSSIAGPSTAIGKINWQAVIPGDAHGREPDKAPIGALSESEPGQSNRRAQSGKLSQRQFRTTVDQLIEQARARGQFDNLPGKGKPLDLTDQPGERDGTWAASHVLKNVGFKPPWRLVAEEIDADLAACRELLRQAPLASRMRRRELLAAYRERAQAAREKTFRYNLMAPSLLVHRPAVNVDALVAEMERAIKE